MSWEKFFGTKHSLNDDEEDGIVSPYQSQWNTQGQYGFDRKLRDEEEEDDNIFEKLKKEIGDNSLLTLLRKRHDIDAKRREKKEEKARKSKALEEFQKTGVWRGYSYFDPPRLDSRYIEQIANALASRYKIDVRTGDGWHVDLKKKVLTYNPDTLLDSTKGRMLASLLHEIGHIRYTTPSDEIVSDYLVKYPQEAHHVVNLYEDIRIDTIMAKSYGSAEDIFDQNKPIVRELAMKYAQKAEFVRTKACEMVTHHLKTKYGINGRITSDQNGKKTIEVTDLFTRLHPPDELVKEKPLIMKARQSELGNKTLDADVTKKLKDVVEGILNMDTLEDYSAGILLKGYGEKIPGKIPQTMMDRITKTEHAIPTTTKCQTTQELTTILDTDVYPVIEDLFDRERLLEDMMKGALGDAAKQLAKDIVKSIEASKAAGSGKKTPAGEMEARDGGSDRGNDIPPSWASGEYDPLKNSVKVEADRLVRRLKLIKKEESVPRWNDNHKRGKIHTKSLHKFPSGNTRLFKRKEELPQTVDAHAFTVFLDVSGSMYTSDRHGNSNGVIIQATRASVLFAEVFNKLGIPFELVTFDSVGTAIKPFSAPMTPENKRKLAGIPRRSGGGSTNLDQAFKTSKIMTHERPAKVIVIISDGGIGDFRYYDKELRQAKQAGAKLIGISIGAGPDIVRFCGAGEEVDDVSKLPDVFSRIIREQFKGGKRRNF